MRLPFLCMTFVAVAVAPCLATFHADGTRPLRIALVDVEGGGGTLIVTPAGQAVLIDTGWARADHRDSDRILAAMKAAGVHKIDYLISTHFHEDHIGGLQELAAKVPIGELIDHGLPASPPPDDMKADLVAAYIRLTQGKRHTARLGEKLPLRQWPGTPAVSITVLTEAQNIIHAAQAPANSRCSALTSLPKDTSDNANSVATVLQFGSFRYFDGGDLTWNTEGKLVCPQDEVGGVTVYQTDHHGLEISNNPVLLATLHPQVVVENNGAQKGGQPAAYRRLQAVVSPRDIYQQHRNIDSSAADNAPPANTANVGTTDTGFGLHLVVASDGMSYRVINERTGQARAYRVP